jgi:hypothetical protein
MNWRFMSLVVTTQLASGCYSAEEAGNTTTLKFDSQFVLGLAAAAITALVVGMCS